METKHDPARAFLESVREARVTLARCRWKLQQAKAQCDQITAQINVSGVSGHGGDGHKDARWAALADLRDILEEQYNRALRAEIEVERFLSRVEDSNQRAVLRMRYADCLPWTAVQERLQAGGIYYSERQIFRLHGEALQTARRLHRELYPEQYEQEGEP